MKRVLVGMVFAVGIFAAYGHFAADRTSGALPPDPLVTGSVAPPSHPVHPASLVLSNAVRGSSCTIRRLRGIGGGLVPERRCDGVWPGLAGVVAMKRSGRDGVAMKDGSGRTVLLLAAGDGVAYEAIEPRNALISVSESE